MTDSSFSVAFRSLGSALAVDLRGDLTKQAEETLLEAYPWDKGLAEGKRFLILNLKEVPYINSAGIAILIRTLRSGRKAGFQSFAYGVTQHYQKLFRMVGLTEFMMIYPDEYSILQRIEG